MQNKTRRPRHTYIDEFKNKKKSAIKLKERTLN